MIRAKLKTDHGIGLRGSVALPTRFWWGVGCTRPLGACCQALPLTRSRAKESMTKAAKSDCSHCIVSDIAQQCTAQHPSTKASSRPREASVHALYARGAKQRLPTVYCSGPLLQQTKLSRSSAASVAGVAAVAAIHTAAAARVADVTAATAIAPAAVVATVAPAVAVATSMGDKPQGQGLLRLVPQCLAELLDVLSGARLGDRARVAACVSALAHAASTSAGALHLPNMLTLLVPPGTQHLRLTRQILLQLLLLLRLGLRGVAAHACASTLAAPTICVLHLAQHTQMSLDRHRRRC
mmetsp:Transcript_46522/g.133039  ORF Transcript_46522/g.133039 Transcript_46522/m.133039 type:complete len:296 (-) Transcript_46522:178-1065(-)